MYLNYINNFRGLAILFIIITHVIAFFNYGNNELLSKTLFILFADATIFFVFISGFLFQHLSNKYEYRNYLNKKFRFVILPYIIISFPAIIYYAFINNESGSSIIKLIKLILTGGALPPTWFIPMIAIFFIISPLLIYIDKKPNLYKYIIPLSIIMSFIVPRGIGISQPVMQNACHFFSIYLIGMAGSRYKDLIFKNSLKYMPGLISLVVAFTVLSIVYDINHILFNTVLYLSKLFSCFLLLTVLYKFDGSINKNFDLLAKYSFGLFFLHGYYIVIIQKFISMYKISINFNIFYFILACGFVILVSMGSVFIIKKIFRNNSKYFVGC
jgi:surface polysaccharide O-acyltransferase-like enzyme